MRTATAIATVAILAVAGFFGVTFQ